MRCLRSLSAEDKQLVRTAWKILERHINELGLLIFQMVFEQSPDTKALFPFMKLTQRKSDKVSKEIEFHGLRVMQIIQTTVVSLDNLDKLEPLLDNLGRRHGRLTVSRGFSPHHWSVFIECCLFYFRSFLKQDPLFFDMLAIDRIIILWRQILKDIIKRMKASHPS